MTRNQQLANALNLSGFVFGAVGLLAPRVLRKGYGATETNTESETVLRMWAIRLIQISAFGTVVADDAGLRARGLQLLVAANVTTAATVLRAGTSGAVPMRVAVQLAATDLAFAGAALVALQD